MSLYICFLIILFSGISGGIINTLLKYLPQISPQTDVKINVLTKAPTNRFPRLQIVDSMIFGIGAAILMPLFLEFAHSDLLDHMNCDFSWGDGDKKNYLLFFAYCLLASISGTQFIKKLAKSVIKSKIEKLEKKIKEKNVEIFQQEETISLIEKEIQQKEEEIQHKAEKENRAIEESLLLAENEESNALQWVDKHPGTGVNFEKLKSSFDTKIGDINPLDRQKGRFGGLQENNGRRISAIIKASDIPGLYLVTIMVEKTDPSSEDLSGYVLFYLHDSFRPCVRIELVKGRKAVLPDLKSIGAYTIGAIADNGDTFLEYDLSESPEATEEFKSV